MEQMHALNSLIGKRVRVIDSNGAQHYGILETSGDMYITANNRNTPCFWAEQVTGLNTLERTIEINFQVTG